MPEHPLPHDPSPLGRRRRTTGRPARALAALVAVAALLAAPACTGDDGGAGEGAGPAGTGPALAAPPPPSVIPAEDAATPTIPVPEGFVVPDTRNVSLRPVIGRPQPELDPDANLLPMTGGEATLTVEVVGPDGRGAGGAVVRLERFVGPLKGWIDVTANGDGQVVVADVPGGRYRIRAWVRPNLTTTEPQLVFLRVDEDATVKVRVEPHEAFLVQGALTQPTWRVGDVVAFEALLVQEEVGDDGIIRGRPVQGEVTLAPIAGFSVDGSATGLTDPLTGRLVLPVRCGATGIHQANLVANGQAVVVFLPECLPGDPTLPPPPEPTTTTTAAPAGRGATSTTTTSTTVVEPVTLPVGRTFTVPFAGPLPVGTYSVAAGDTCVTTYELLRNGRWVRQQATGPSLTTTAPVRNLAPAPDTDPCTFRRVR